MFTYLFNVFFCPVGKKIMIYVATDIHLLVEKLNSIGQY